MHLHCFHAQQSSKTKTSWSMGRRMLHSQSHRNLSISVTKIQAFAIKELLNHRWKERDLIWSCHASLKWTRRHISSLPAVCRWTLSQLRMSSIGTVSNHQSSQIRNAIVASISCFWLLPWHRAMSSLQNLSDRVAQCEGLIGALHRRCWHLQKKKKLSTTAIQSLLPFVLQGYREEYCCCQTVGAAN